MTVPLHIGETVAIFYLDFRGNEHGLRMTADGTVDSLQGVFFDKKNKMLFGRKIDESKTAKVELKGTLLEIWYREKNSGPIYVHHCKPGSNIFYLQNTEKRARDIAWAAKFKKIRYTKGKGIS